MNIARISAAAIVTLMVAFAFGPGARTDAQQSIGPQDFSPRITHPLFPLSLIGPKVFEGEEVDADTGETIEQRLESRLLPGTETVAGVTVSVLEEKAYEGGELVEVALDYFAQHRDGSVYYFGERVDNYEDGELRDHAGQWLAGEDGNEAGIIMPASPVVGQTFQQENAPGVAEDMATVLALDESVTVRAGSYTGCMRTREFTPLEPGIEEFKWHCPGVGLVKEEGDGMVNELVSVGAGPATPEASASAAPAAPATAATGVTVPSTGTGSREGVSWVAIIVVIGAAVAAGAMVTGALMRRSAR